MLVKNGEAPISSHMLNRYNTHACIVCVFHILKVMTAWVLFLIIVTTEILNVLPLGKFVGEKYINCRYMFRLDLICCCKWDVESKVTRNQKSSEPKLSKFTDIIGMICFHSHRSKYIIAVNAC